MNFIPGIAYWVFLHSSLFSKMLLDDEISDISERSEVWYFAAGHQEMFISSFDSLT